VKSDRRVDIAIGHSITVRKQKRVLFDEFQDPFQPATGIVAWPVSTSVTFQSSSSC
jgi:hypothetical protein